MWDYFTCNQTRTIRPDRLFRLAELLGDSRFGFVLAVGGSLLHLSLLTHTQQPRVYWTFVFTPSPEPELFSSTLNIIADVLAADYAQAQRLSS